MRGRQYNARAVHLKRHWLPRSCAASFLDVEFLGGRSHAVRPCTLSAGRSPKQPLCRPQLRRGGRDLVGKAVMSVQRRKRLQRGQTLLELVGATTILAVALVPALRLMRDSVRVVGELGTSNLLATLCVSKLEEHLQKTAANWSTVSVSGDYAAEGYAGLRFTVVRSDAAADGGIPGSLMSIVVTSWEDRTANGTPDTGEPRVAFAGKLARLVTYHHEASGT